MAETTKETKTAAKPRKPATRKKATQDTNGSVTPINGSVSKEEVARLAHRLFEERGRNHGYHMEDWFRAEQQLLGRAS